MSDVAEIGECVLRREFDELYVDRADPKVHIGAEFLSEVIREQGFGSPIRLTPAPPDYPLRSDEHHVGALLRIEGSNRTVVYRITGYDLKRDWYLAEWPD